MDIDYTVIGAVVFAGVCLIGFLIWRNVKDEKKFEKDITRSELKPEKHGDTENRN